ncbi:MAG TPA: Gfo/Idh/MocA family oxidoreductase [Polyangia bacterium]
MFRFGILGASYFATHKMIPAMQAAGDTPVVAIASRDGTKAAEAARALGIPKTYDSYDALLADPDVDGVYVPLPNHLHVAWAEKAAAAGKHVLVEKPVALGAAEARRLLAARDAHKVIICEAAMVRLHPRWLAVRELVRKGKIGELGAFVGTFGYDLSARRDNVRFVPDMGGGVLLDVGFYPVTMSRFCFDDEPTEVVAHMERESNAGVDVMTSAVLRFPRGHAVFTCGMQLAPQQRAQLLGSKGHIDLLHAWNPANDRPSALVLETSAQLEVTAAEHVEFAAVNQYTILAQLFARAAAAGGGPGPIPLEDSIKNMAALDALRRSAVSRRWETV